MQHNFGPFVTYCLRYVVVVYFWTSVDKQSANRVHDFSRSSKVVDFGTNRKRISQ